MTLTKARHLVIAAVVAAVVAYFLVLVGYGSMPRLPLFAGITLLLVAAVEVVLTLVVRPKVRRKQGVEPLDALVAARAVVLAKASSVAGSLVAGAWLGLLGYVLPLSSFVEAAGGDTASAVIGLVSALALVAAGLWLEHTLRNPDEPEEDDGPERSG